MISGKMNVANKHLTKLYESFKINEKYTKFLSVKTSI